MYMNKGSIEIVTEADKHQDRYNLPDGIYVADWCDKNDRVVLISGKKVIAVFEKVSDKINVQLSSSGDPTVYTNYKSVKNFDLKVTL